MKIDGKPIYNKLTCTLTRKWLGHTVEGGLRKQADAGTSMEARELQPRKQTDFDVFWR